MKSFLIALATIAVVYSNAYSQAGSAGFLILRMGFSAKDLSLASSADAVTDEPVAVFLNPAGLSSAGRDAGTGPSFVLTHRTYVAGTTIDLFGTRFQAGGTSIGAGLLLSSVPDIEVRNVPGDPIATFSAKDFSFALGAARKFDRLDIGISAMYLYEKLFIYESSGYAFNAGANYSLTDNVRLGMAVGNLGTSSAMIQQKITLPAFIRLGASYSTKVGNDLSATGYAGLVTYKSGGITPSVGADVSFDSLIHLRAGYATGNDITGVSFGAGVHYGIFLFDYSYVPMKLDYSQTFTLSFIL